MNHSAVSPIAIGRERDGPSERVSEIQAARPAGASCQVWAAFHVV